MTAVPQEDPPFSAPHWSGLPAPHAQRVRMQPLPQPVWGDWNEALASSLGLAAGPSTAWLQRLSGHTVAAPWCSAYAGHQFGVWAGLLGDGRAHTLGCLNTEQGPQEIQLKGAGLTPFSRMGDGRAVLRSSIREYLCSEAMAGLGIPTTRALALVGSPLPVQRETRETAAIVTRVAPSFMRIGHFEHLSHHGHRDALRQLFALVLEDFFPACAAEAQPALALLQTVIERTARLMAQWQCVGFCHGVMNTDNMSILGLTLDYGPFGFLEAYDAQHICNHSDRSGRYAYAQQPLMGWWNCGALASALQPLIQDAQATQNALDTFETLFEANLLEGFRAKLGWRIHQEEDALLIQQLLALMQRDQVDFTGLFRALSVQEPSALRTGRLQAPSWVGVDSSHPDWAQWLQAYDRRCTQEPGSPQERRAAMQGINPKYVLRNHLAQEAIEAAQGGDFQCLHALRQVLQSPFQEHPEWSRWAQPAAPGSPQVCVSCSS